MSCRIRISIINNLKSNYYNCTDGLEPKLHYGIIRYIIKEDTFIIIDSHGTSVCDVRIDFLDINALSSKGGLTNEEIKSYCMYKTTNNKSHRLK